jgi:hypothetical protein
LRNISFTCFRILRSDWLGHSYYDSENNTHDEYSESSELADYLDSLGKRALGLNDIVNASAYGHRIRIRPRGRDIFVAAQIFGATEYHIGKT